MRSVLLYSTDSVSPGINKILENLLFELKKRNLNAKIVYEINSVHSEDVVIPYGIKAAYELFKINDNIQYVIMPDAYTLGWINKIIFYLKRGKLFYYDLYYSAYQILKYSFREYSVLRRSKNIIYVSSSDISVMQKFFREKKFFLAQNGVDVPLYRNQQLRNSRIDASSVLVLGSISNWNKVSIDEVKWFIEDSLPRLRVKFPNLKIKLAGKDVGSYAKNIFNKVEGVEYIGEVPNLCDFFSKIDIFIATVPKGVGILNKVIDSFAYERLVIGLPQCFYAFPENSDGFIPCENYIEFENAINLYLYDCEQVNKIVEKSYNYIKSHHNWSDNYAELVDHIVNNMYN